MGLYIPEDIIQQVKDATDIRQVVEAHVPLKKRGRNWVGLCPFHEDTDPSFSINEDKQIFYCFGCGQGGDVFKFVMNMEGLSFYEAVKALAARNGISIPEQQRSKAAQKRLARQEELYKANEEAVSFYHEYLLAHPSAYDARDYLKERGITEKIIKEFHLGWAPDRWDSLVNHLEKMGVALKNAASAGLVIEREAGGFYDRFRARIIFPILDKHGKITALGGRVLDDSIPKYLNSPESAIYHKGRVLYGLYQAKGHVRKNGYGYVVEGYMDLLALVQNGISNCVATLGTALTEEHSRMLKSLSKTWTLVFDGDEAGTKAALRAIPLLYKYGINVKVLNLPKDDDPDTFIRREGIEGWQNAQNQAADGIDFAINIGLKTHGRGPDGLYATVDDVIPILRGIQDPVRQALLVAHVSQKLKIREQSLWQKLSQGDGLALQKRGGNRLAGTGAPAPSVKNKAEEKIFCFLLNYPEFMDIFLESGMEIWLENEKLLDLWRSLVHVYSIENRLDLATLFLHLHGLQEVHELATRLKEETMPCDDPDVTARKLLHYSEEMKKKALRRQIIEQLAAGVDGKECEALLRKVQELH